MTANDANGRVTIPQTDADGFFGIRLESIGGLGAHLAGQILAEAAVLDQGLNGAHFSSYGSEKKGSPVKSFVRLCASDREIRTSAPIENPQVVAVFHEALTRTLDVAAGLSKSGTLIMNSRLTPEEVRAAQKTPIANIAVVDALGIAVEEKTRVNTAMLGAICRVVPFLNPDAVKQQIAAKLGVRYGHLVAANLRTFDRGYAEVKLQSWPVEGADEPVQPARIPPAFGYLDAPIGGVITDPANSVVKNLTASRQGFIPEYHAEKCVHCGICDIVCPDLCFVWQESEDPTAVPAIKLQGIDYNYCKGCLKCTSACPTGALTDMREEEGYADEHRVPLYSWL